MATVKEGLWRAILRQDRQTLERLFTEDVTFHLPEPRAGRRSVRTCCRRDAGAPVTGWEEIRAVRGDDGRRRCGWATTAPDYVTYHDEEWGRPVVEDIPIYEKLSLEGFQSGLSWLTILRKREGFRRAFSGFVPEIVAGFGAEDVERLLADPGIVRHRRKIEAAIANAGATLAARERHGSLAALVWSFEPKRRGPAPRRLGDVPAVTPESTALSKALHQLGFRFIGPTTVYAAMQALGVVNDHLAGCHVRAECSRARRAVMPPAG